MAIKSKNSQLELLLDYQEFTHDLLAEEYIQETLYFIEKKIAIQCAFFEINGENNITCYRSRKSIRKINSASLVAHLLSHQKPVLAKELNSEVEALIVFEKLTEFYIIPSIYRESRFGALYLLFTSSENRPIEKLNLIADQLTMLLDKAKKPLQLSRSERRFEALMASSRDHVMVLDTDLIVTDINTTIEEYSKSDVLGKSILDLHTDREQRSKAQKCLTESFEKGIETSYESIIWIHDRKYFYHTTVIPCCNHGRVTEVILLSRDVTSIEHVQKSLETSEKRYRTLVESAKSVILRFDNKGIIQFANQFAVEFFGFSKEELEGVHVSETIVPKIDSYGNDLTIMVNEAFNNPQDFENNENENICKDGRRVWVSWANRPVFDGQGNFIELLSIGNDITNLKEKEIQLTQQSQIIDQINDAIVCTDMNGQIFYANKGASKISGFALEEMIGASPEIFYNNQFRKFSEPTLIINELEKKGNYSIITDGTTKKGEHYEIELSFSLLKGTDDQPYGLLSYGRDITSINKDKRDLTLLASIVENSNDVIGISDLDSNVLYVNEAGKDLLGMGDYTKTQFVQYFPEYEFSRLAEEIIPIVMEKGRWSGESVFKNISTGEEIDVLFDIFRIDDPATGEPINLATVSRDIRHLKSQQRQLEESELALKEAQQIGKMGSWEHNLISNELTWSDETYRILGFEVGELAVSLQVFLEFVHPDDRKMVKNAYEAHVRLGKEYDVTHRIYTKEGKIKHLRERAITLMDDNNQPLKTVGTSADITDQKIIELELEHYKNNLEELVKKRTLALEQALQELNRSEEKFRGLVEGTSMGVGMTDGDKIFYANKALLNMFGYDNEQEFYAKNIFEHSTPTSRKLLIERVRKLKEGIQIDPTFQCAYNKKNGEEIICQVAVNDIYIDNKKYRQSSFLDMTELLKTKEKLRRSEELYRTLTDTLRDVISIYDAEYNCVLVSQGVEEVLGYSVKEIMALDIESLIHPEERAIVGSKIKSAIQHRSSTITYRTRIRSKNGKYVPVEHVTKLKYNAKNKFERFISSSRDITERIKVERKLHSLNEGLKKSNFEYRKLAEELSKQMKEVNHKNELIKNQNEMLTHSEYELKLLNAQLQVRNNAINEIAIVSITDYNGKIIEINQRFCEVSKYKANEVKGKTMNVLNSGYHSKEFFREMWSTIESGQVWRGEINNRAKDGSEFWLLKTIVPFFPKEGTERFYFSLSSDITEQKERELELAEAKRNAERAMQVKEEFLSVMSHEIRTPLNSVIGLSELLMDRDPREDQQDVIKTLNFSADNLMRLINDILDFSKIEARKLVIEKQRIDLHALLYDIIDAHRIAASEKHIDLDLQIAAELPNDVLSDPLRLKQILNNLVSNAIKFTDEGRVTIEVDLTRPNEDKVYLKFVISDTGIGIPPEDKKLIFEAFEQSRKQKASAVGGTGLGLAIVKNLVSLFQGKIYFTSVIDKGSQFIVELPCELPCELAAESRLKQSVTHNRELHVEPSGKKLLYVEDVATNQFLMQKFLAGHQISCELASSGEEALRLIKKEKFDFILMDIQMSDMDGYETTLEIRKYNEYYNEVPIIAFTADTSEQTQSKIIEVGMNDVLTKPLDSAKLIALLNKYLAIMQKSKDVDFSLEYFTRAFNNDEQKLVEVYKILIDDLNKFYSDFISYYKQQDYDGMRKEIHKMEPILSHLNHQKILRLFETYKSYNTVDEKMKTLNKELLEHIKKMEAHLNDLRS